MIARIRKALLAAIGAAGTGLGVALEDGAISQAEIAWMIGLGIVAGLTVWRVPNAPQR